MGFWHSTQLQVAPQYITEGPVEALLSCTRKRLQSSIGAGGGGGNACRADDDDVGLIMATKSATSPV
eukprot:5310378-Lingulodinium_polyedra.AAC.1